MYQKRSAIIYKMVRVEEYEHKMSSWFPNIQSFVSYRFTIMKVHAVIQEEAPNTSVIGANLCFC